MDIRAVVFDVNGTLVKIRTEDGRRQIFRAAAHFLTYQGIDLHGDEVQDLYVGIMKKQLRSSPQRYPEYDAVDIWRTIIDAHRTEFTDTLPREKLEQMPLFLAEMTRGISRRRLGLYPHTRQVLDVLRESYPLAIVSDAQSAYVRGELHKVGLLDYFNPIVISGDHGFCKPDPRLFHLALDQMGVTGEQALFVGDNLDRDIIGARQVGMTTVLFNPPPGLALQQESTPHHTITNLRELLTILPPRARPHGPRPADATA
ncbi:MAG: HAD family hydrolase [Dermatophilaceae bacterium]